MNTERSHSTLSPTEPGLPPPSRHAAWRWATARRAAVGGSVLAAVLSLSAVGAAAATTPNGSPPTGRAAHGGPGNGMKPTAMGKITALSGDDITITETNKTTVTVVFSTSTTFRTMSGTASSSDLKVGDYIAAQGTKSSGTVTAKSIMISTKAFGKMGGPSGRTRPGGKSGAPPTGGTPG